MKIEYEARSDILNIEFLPGADVADSIDRDGIIVDLTKDRRIVSIEILDASKRTRAGLMDRLDFAILRDQGIKP